MSTTDGMAGIAEQAEPMNVPIDETLPRFENPIVPSTTIAGSALVAIVAIMTFLAALTTGAVVLVRGAAADWQSEIAHELTIQVRPVTGRDIDADVNRAAEIARSFAGVTDVRVYSRDDAARLLEPWLGSGLALDDLPVPRLIAVRIGPDVDLARLRQTLTEQSPAATLDDHRGFVDRMRAMSNAMVFGGVALLVLVLIATFISVAFATRGAMAANRTVIEVLHFIGARNDFIATHFQRRFLVLGLKGGLIGSAGAITLFLIADLIVRWLPGSETVGQFAALFGSLSIGLVGYAVLLVQALIVAVVTAIASRVTVNRTLDSIH